MKKYVADSQLTKWVKEVRRISLDKLGYDITELYADEDMAENMGEIPENFVHEIAAKYDLTYKSEVML